MGQYIATHAEKHQLPRRVVLASAVGQTLAKLLHPNMTVPPQAIVKEDEVHLILEYSKGEQWGKAKAHKANRFIFSHDMTNAELRPLEAFTEIVGSELDSLDYVVFSGIHMLEGQPAEFRARRLQDLVRFLDTMPATIPVHLELASIGDEKFVSQLADIVLHRVDSIGLNEQELGALARAAGGPHVESHNSNTAPLVEVVADTLYWMLDRFGGQNGRLSRVHFHFIAFHMTAARAGYWSKVKEATAAGTLTCSLMACQMEKPKPEKLEIQFPQTYRLHRPPDDTEEDYPLSRLARWRQFNPKDPVTSWTRGVMHFTVSPVLVCKKPVKTVGLGDAISATGLEYSIFHTIS
eukprot:m.72339 g.72339  ORF g.72339 m.72339 type:complete len:350 (-) comp20243_c0_seq1:134-1183(-)